MRRKTLEALLAGQFICSIAFPLEYEDLQDEQVREAVSRWLAPLERRLARVNANGAFYMAPELIGTDEVRQVREEMRAYRDIYAPAFMALDLIRQADPDSVALEPGEYVQASRLETALGINPALEMQLNSLSGSIRRFVLKNSMRDRIDAVLDHLTAEGFLVRVEKDRANYRFTGRVEHLWAIAEFIEQNEPIAKEIDTDNAQEDLADDGDLGELTP